ncbi:MAG: SBBP repeat-containing protein, partial [candidate division WOR-3 bacterium]
DGSGNVYVTGYSWGSGTSYDYATIKYNSQGVEQWVARYNGPGNIWDWAYAIAVDGSGNVYVTGYSYGSGTYGDYATIKYNSSGQVEWVARYNGPGNSYDCAYAIAVDGLGNVYVTGESYGSGTSYDYATVKYNSQGVEQWVARYNGPVNSYDYAYAIAVDGSGNVYVTGESYGSGTSYDYATVKYNSQGVEQWVARYNGPGNGWDEASAIAVDGSGNVYVTGKSYGSDSLDYATVKYNSQGVEQWVARYNGPGNDYDWARAIAVDGLGNVYVTGYSDGSGTSYDYATIKYVQTGVPSQPQISVTPSSFNLTLQQGQNKDTILRISNTGTANLSWSLTEVPSVTWLSENPTSGNIPASGQTNVTVSFNTSGLSPATYQCTLRITSNDPVNPTVNVPVALTVSSTPQPQISVTPSSFNLNLQQGQNKDTILRISNTGTANLTWSLTEVPSVTWLSENPTSGNIPASGQTNVTVSFNTSGLSPATYQCTLRINSNDPVNPTVNVLVQLTVQSGNFGSLSGTVYDIRIDFNNGILDSTQKVSNAQVSLYQNNILKYGPVSTNQNGAYSLTNIVSGEYELRVLKIITPTYNPVRPKLKDTVIIKRPVTIAQGTNTKNVILPIGLVEQKYFLIYKLENLHTIPVPDLGVTIPLPVGYNESNIQALLDYWTTNNITPEARIVLERLLLVEGLLALIYDDAAALGAEATSVALDLVYCIVSVISLGHQINTQLVGLSWFDLSINNWITEQIIRGLLELFGILIESGASKLGPPAASLIPAFYQMLYERACELLDGDSPSYSTLILLGAQYFFQPLVQEIYVARTQPALNDAFNYAYNLNYSGTFPNAYDEMATFHTNTAQTANDALQFSQTIRTIANITQTIGSAFTLIGSVPGIQQLWLLGNILLGLSVGGYGWALYRVGEPFVISIPNGVRNEVGDIFFPPSKFLLTGNYREFTNYRYRKSFYQSKHKLNRFLDEYQNLLDSLKLAIQNSDTTQVRALLIQLPNIDLNYESEMSPIVHQVYTKVNSVLDSIPNLDAIYDSTFKHIWKTTAYRTALPMMIYAFYGEPNIQYRDSLIAIIDTTKVSLSDAIQQISVLSDSLERFLSPPNCFIKQIHSPGILDTGQVFVINAIVSNSGDENAYDVSLSLKTNQALKLLSDSIIDIGTIEPYDEVSVSCTLLTKPFASKVGVCRFILSSSNAVSFSRSTNVTIIQPGNIWRQRGYVPEGPYYKKIKSGGALLTDGVSRIFAFKGNNTNEFYVYDILSNSWTDKCTIPQGDKRKRVKAGASLCYDGINTIYALKGGNTQEFWAYDIETNSWSQLKDVPLGASNKKIKGGSGLVFATKGDSSFVFCLKGSKTNEFYAYYVQGDTWLKRKDAPLGLSSKGFDKGSCITYNGNDTIYALKNKYNEFFAYAITSDTWITRQPMPMNSIYGRNKKVKDGASMAYHPEGIIYAFKGGNTQEFWAYDVSANNWTVKETIPKGPTGKKKVGAGGSLCYAMGHIFALKGNNTLEFWRYTPGAEIATLSLAITSGENGIMAQPTKIVYPFMLYQNNPNPFKTQTTISYSIPTETKVSLMIYDVSGRLVKALVDEFKSPGIYSINWNGTDEQERKVGQGVYFYVLKTADNKTQKKMLMLK